MFCDLFFPPLTVYNSVLGVVTAGELNFLRGIPVCRGFCILVAYLVSSSHHFLPHRVAVTI